MCLLRRQRRLRVQAGLERRDGEHAEDMRARVSVCQGLGASAGQSAVIPCPGAIALQFPGPGAVGQRQRRLIGAEGKPQAGITRGIVCLEDDAVVTHGLVQLPVQHHRQPVHPVSQQSVVAGCPPTPRTTCEP